MGDKKKRQFGYGSDQTNTWRYKPRATTCRNRTTDRIGINMSRDELDLVVEALRTALAWHFDVSQRAGSKPADELSAAYARDRYDQCVTMLNWIQPLHDQVDKHATIK